MNKTILKYSLLYLILFLLVSLTIQGTITYLKLIHYKENEVVLGTVIPEIVENSSFNSGIRENICIKNIGNSPIYIRISLIYYFENEKGEIIKDKPILDNDYTINFSKSENWIKSNEGYYYYKLILKPGELTDNLIDRLEEVNIQDNNKFKMDIAVQAIQAKPDRAIIEAWNVIIENDKIFIQ